MLSAAVLAREKSQPRHTAFVRVTHWITAVCVIALIFTGANIVISHPRFYWGENGNVLTGALFELPIPASRSSVNTGYGYVLPDQNGWSRSLHFQAAWLVVLTGFVYAGAGLARGHLRRNLLPNARELTLRSLRDALLEDLRHGGPADRYNPLQKVTYLSVIFVLFPMLIWTGLAMSPAIVAVWPAVVTTLGGHQSARTLHFFATALTLAFIAVHLAMVVRSGFRSRMRGITFGSTSGKSH